MKKLLILIVIVLVSCSEKFETGPYTYVGQIYDTDYIPSKTTLTYSHIYKRMVTNTEPAKYYVYYDFLEEKLRTNDYHLFDTCSNFLFDSLEITYYKKYYINKKQDTLFRKNIIRYTNPK